MSAATLPPQETVEGVAAQLESWIRLGVPGIVWIRYFSDVSRDRLIMRLRADHEIQRIDVTPPTPEEAATWLEAQLPRGEPMPTVAVVFSSSLNNEAGKLGRVFGALNLRREALARQTAVQLWFVPLSIAYQAEAAALDLASWFQIKLVLGEAPTAASLSAEPLRPTVQPAYEAELESLEKAVARFRVLAESDRSSYGRALGWALVKHAIALDRIGELTTAMAEEKEAERLFTDPGAGGLDREGLAASYGNQALILQAWGRLVESMELLKKQEALCLELGDRAGLSRSYANQALILQEWGRLEEAMKLHKEEEALWREMGDHAGLSRSHGNQALILQKWGRLEEAIELHKKEEALCGQMEDRAGLSVSYGNQAVILQKWGRLDEAMELHKKQEELSKALGDPVGLGHSLFNQAVLVDQLGDRVAAMELMRRAKALYEEVGIPEREDAERQLEKWSV